MKPFLYFLLYVCKSHLACRTQADWCLCLKFQTRWAQWKHFTWRNMDVNFTGNIYKSPCRQNSQLESGRTRPPPTPPASSPAPWASSWSWQDGSQSCSTEKVVKSIRMTFQVVASWPGNPQQTLCLSSPGQKDTLSCSWRKKETNFHCAQSSICDNRNLNPSSIIASPCHQLTYWLFQ